MVWRATSSTPGVSLTPSIVRRVEEGATGVNYSHNGLYIAYTNNAGETPEVVIMNLNSSTIPLAGEIRCRPRGLEEIAQVQWSPNDSLLIIYDGDFCAYVHNPLTGEQIGECIENVPNSNHLSWNNNGDAICYVGSGQNNQANCVIIRKLLTGEDIIFVCGKPNDWFINADWSPDGTKICTMCHYGSTQKAKIQIWDVSL